MKKRITIEEVVKFHHEIIVVGSEEDIDSAIENMSDYDCLDEYIDGLEQYVKVVDVYNDYEGNGGESDDIEFYDEEIINDDIE
ncbi:hypothetical protein SDC9_46825 [bioreactor metagenome]|uniref:Uncharacterized protein n=1 Tax=bioreactor metagenome TaxID=1076179 RepID=A0A644WAQ9_9ZZZZ